jgi:hypothetical protein
MNNIVMRKVNVTASYQALVNRKLVASVTISALPTNAGPVYFRGDDGLDVPWLPGEWHEFQSVNVGEILVKGAVGDAMTVVGGTW